MLLCFCFFFYPFSLAGSNASTGSIGSNASNVTAPECGGATLNKSPSKKNRRITFDERLVHSPCAAALAASAAASAAASHMDPVCKSALPPTLPRRDPLKSSMKQHSAVHPAVVAAAAAATGVPAMGKLNSPGCTVTPPRDFLKDLQRVMQKKWQVAQKCKDDSEVTPHEVIHPSAFPPFPGDSLSVSLSKFQSTPEFVILSSHHFLMFHLCCIRIPHSAFRRILLANLLF